MAKISVCLPTYNGCEYLPDCILSIQEQTFKDWELIVVNDGSTDSTEELLDFYSNEDKRIKVVNLEKNEGISFARQTACELATGEFITVMDTDCQMMPTRLEESLQSIKKNDVIYTDFSLVVDGEVREYPVEDFGHRTVAQLLDRKHPTLNQIIPNFTIMAKREAFKDAFRIECRYNDDLWTVLQWVKRGYSIKHLRKVLTYHYITGDNVTINKKEEVETITEKIRREEGI